MSLIMICIILGFEGLWGERRSYEDRTEFLCVWLLVLMSSVTTRWPKLGFLSVGSADASGWLILGCGGTILCIVGCLAASLASAHEMLVAPLHLPSPTNKNVFRHCQTLPGEQNHPQLRITDLNAEISNDTVLGTELQAWFRFRRPSHWRPFSVPGSCPGHHVAFSHHVCLR